MINFEDVQNWVNASKSLFGSTDSWSFSGQRSNKEGLAHLHNFRRTQPQIWRSLKYDNHCWPKVEVTKVVAFLEGYRLLVLHLVFILGRFARLVCFQLRIKVGDDAPNVCCPDCHHRHETMLPGPKKGDTLVYVEKPKQNLCSKIKVIIDSESLYHTLGMSRRQMAGRCKVLLGSGAGGWLTNLQVNGTWNMFNVRLLDWHR